MCVDLELEGEPVGDQTDHPLEEADHNCDEDAKGSEQGLPDVLEPEMARAMKAMPVMIPLNTHRVREAMGQWGAVPEDVGPQMSAVETVVVSGPADNVARGPRGREGSNDVTCSDRGCTGGAGAAVARIVCCVTTACGVWGILRASFISGLN